jgi:hypothetical protein
LGACAGVVMRRAFSTVIGMVAGFVAIWRAMLMAVGRKARDLIRNPSTAENGSEFT